MLNAVKKVLGSTQEQLYSIEYVESLIKEFGLFHDPRNLYGEPYNQWQVDHGGIWQQPRQLAQSMIWLSDKDIKSYLDIGTFYGDTFSFICSYLKMFGLTRAVALDTNRYFCDIDILRFLLGIEFEISYIFREDPIIRSGTGSMASLAASYKYDLVFIDGNHQYSVVKDDYESVGMHAKYCMFHDINDEYVERECEGKGPVGFWRDLGKPNNKVEYLYHPEGKRVMGIGILNQTCLD